MSAGDGRGDRTGAARLPLPWRVTASRRLVRDRWIDLRADDCVDENGTEIAPFYVLSYRDWAQVVAITPDGRIPLVRQYRHGAGMTTRELPSGVIDPQDASPEAAGARELLEETGFRCASLRLVGSTWNNPASCDNRVHTVLGEGAEKVAAQSLDPTETISVELVTIEQALAYAREGGLHHGAQVASLYLALEAAGRLRR